MTDDDKSFKAKRPPRKAPRGASGRILPAKDHEGERIAKVMARAGLCSRRDAEDWIAAGRVSVNGKVLASAALNVTENDKVFVDGKPLGLRERTRLFLFHKPRGLVTTDRDPEGRATVFDYIAEHNPDLPRLMSVGRLDINTEGLLLLTNDGGLARVLELPATGWLRRYRARANGETDQARLDRLARGVTIDGIDYAGVEAKLDRVQGANVWITLGLREGKNREVKKLLEHLGLAVNRLIRVSYGPFQLGELPEGTVEEVRTRVLADQLGEKLAAEAGVDFDGPVIDRTPEPEISPAKPPRPPRAAEKVRPHRAAPDEARGTQKAGPRKHVSALRDDRAKAEKGPRRRIETSATADRNGRAVKVERVSVARKPEAPADSRNARRFRAEREKQDYGDAPPPRGRAKTPLGRSKTPGAARSADGFRDEAAPRSSRARAAAPAMGRSSERPSRDGRRAEGSGFGAESKPRRENKPGASRGEGGAKPFGQGGAKPFGQPRGETGAAKTFRRGPKPAGGGPKPRGGFSGKPRGKT
jgi:23S rRNA pseudouridine2605 synthase